jgi:hypothetical protein
MKDETKASQDLLNKKTQQMKVCVCHKVKVNGGFCPTHGNFPLPCKEGDPENTSFYESPSLPTGVKHDAEKPDMSLLSNTALVKVAEVMTFGKKKYSAHNWRGGFFWSRPLAAAARHLYAYIGGEDKDPETGLSHIAHCMCCLMMVLEFEETHTGLDDRFKAGK